VSATLQAELAARQFSAHAMQLQLQGPLTAIGDAIEELHAQIRQVDEDAQRERQKHGASDPSAVSPDDVLMLNVGGHLMSVKRQDMTEGEGVEGTLLAALFSGYWGGRLIKDDKQRIFIDMDADAFMTIHKAILNAATMRSAGKMAPVGSFFDTKRHDFWVKLMLSPLNKAAADATPSGGGAETRLTATDDPADTADVVKPLEATIEAIKEAFAAEKARLEGQLRAANRRRDNLDKEIQAVKPFLAPLSGGDAIRSVDVCGTRISTVQSTLDEMGDIGLHNRFDMWPAPIEDVPVDHIRRLVDHYRRKRLGASTEDIDAPLKIGKNAEQAAFDINAAMYGVKTDTPTATDDGFLTSYHTPGCEVRYKVVREGFGRTPTLEQIAITDRVTWRDGFEGNVKDTECRKHMARVSQPGLGYLRDALLSMREGEVRRFICQEDGDVYYDEVSLLQVADDFVFEPPRRRRDYRQVLYA